MNYIDRVVGYFNPKAGLKRAQARAGIEAVRAYDISSKGRRTAGWNRSRTSASQEVSKAEPLGAAAAQELVRNNPSAKRIKRVLAARMVGTGITPEIVSNRKKPGKRRIEGLNQRWEDWAESTVCDFEGDHTFYGLQWLWMNTIVESGGVFIRQHFNATLANPLQLQTFEQSHLDRTRDTQGTTADGVEILDGIQYRNGQREGYWLHKRPTDTFSLYRHHQDSDFYKVDEIVHIFLKERTGQHLGMTWFDASAGVLRNFDVYEDAKLMQQQIAALFALIVEEAPQAAGLNLKSEGTHELPDELEPGMIEYVSNGQSVTTITPPKADASTEFDIGLKQRMSAGAGVTYEQLTGDYSRVNFASGRMGNVEFYAQLEIFQRHMLTPALTKIFGWFLTYDGLAQSAAAGVEVTHDDIKPDWTYPPQVSVEPGAEFDLIIKKVRNGMMSPRKAAKMLGENLQLIIEQWGEDKKLFGKLPFDIDPSMFSSAGNQLDVNSATAAGATAKGGDKATDSGKTKDDDKQEGEK